MPKALRKKREQKREVRYAIGYIVHPENPQETLGMYHGPFLKLVDALEIVPELDNSFIIKFCKDYTQKKLYRWEDDKWMIMKEE